ncbi:MAG: 50S ribosomal protein L25 [Armatimonadota bacterium]|nr:50S ribosomal protein L25 [Armatimonadota bacterium]MDR7543374.1 50S ribosomal protein L25 [Armatimonadota bacterium]
MERVTLEARVRHGLGKGAARSLRRDGFVPGVVYGRGRQPRAVAVEARALDAALHTHAGRNVLIDLDVVNGGDGAGEPTTVIVKDTQRDIFHRRLLHVDFHAISLTDTIEMSVPVVLKGTAKGVSEGGILEHHMREVRVECLPTQVPDEIVLDVTDLLVGRSLHAGDLRVPEGVKLLSSPDEVVVTCLAPRVHEEAVPAAVVEGAPAEGAPAAAPEPVGGTTAVGKPKLAESQKS